MANLNANIDELIRKFDNRLKTFQIKLQKDNLASEKLVKEVAEGRAGGAQTMLEQLEKISGTGVALVYIVPAKDTTLFIVATKKGHFGFIQGPGRDVLGKMVIDFREKIRKRERCVGAWKTDSKCYKNTASNLYEQLIRPVLPFLRKAEVGTVMLYLTDNLLYLPFSALFDKESEKHLTEQFDLAVYTHEGRKTEEPPIQLWSAVALGTSKQYGDLPHLPKVEKEMQRIVRIKGDSSPQGILEGTRLLNEQFNRNNWLGLLRGQSRRPVIHVATHFVPNKVDFERSELLLGTGVGGVEEARHFEGGTRFDNKDWEKLSAS